MNTKAVLVHLACWASAVGGMAAAYTMLPHAAAELSVIQVSASGPGGSLASSPLVGYPCAVGVNIWYPAEADPSDDVMFYDGGQLIGSARPHRNVEEVYAQATVPWTPATPGSHDLVVRYGSQSKSRTVTVVVSAVSPTPSPR